MLFQRLMQIGIKIKSLVKKKTICFFFAATLGKSNSEKTKHGQMLATISLFYKKTNDPTPRGRPPTELNGIS